jgi:hypothetical protein
MSRIEGRLLAAWSELAHALSTIRKRYGGDIVPLDSNAKKHESAHGTVNMVV